MYYLHNSAYQKAFKAETEKEKGKRRSYLDINVELLNKYATDVLKVDRKSEHFFWELSAHHRDAVIKRLATEHNTAWSQALEKKKRTGLLVRPMMKFTKKTAQVPFDFNPSDEIVFGFLDIGRGGPGLEKVPSDGKTTKTHSLQSAVVDAKKALKLIDKEIKGLEKLNSEPSPAAGFLAEPVSGQSTVTRAAVLTQCVDDKVVTLKEERVRQKTVLETAENALAYLNDVQRKRIKAPREDSKLLADIALLCKRYPSACTGRGNARDNANFEKELVVLMQGDEDCASLVRIKGVHPFESPMLAIKVLWNPRERREKQFSARIPRFTLGHRLASDKVAAQTGISVAPAGGGTISTGSHGTGGPGGAADIGHHASPRSDVVHVPSPALDAKAKSASLSDRIAAAVAAAARDGAADDGGGTGSGGGPSTRSATMTATGAKAKLASLSEGVVSSTAGVDPRPAEDRVQGSGAVTGCSSGCCNGSKSTCSFSSSAPSSVELAGNFGDRTWLRELYERFEKERDVHKLTNGYIACVPLIQG